MSFLFPLSMKLAILCIVSFLLIILHEMIHLKALRHYGYDGKIKIRLFHREDSEGHFFYTEITGLRFNYLHMKDRIWILLAPLSLSFLWVVLLFYVFDGDVSYGLIYGILFSLLVSRYDIKACWLVYRWWHHPLVTSL
jgi:hypothetical protein